MSAEDGGKKDGGPAFPGYDVYGDGKVAFVGSPHGGMTLRDWFAGMAMMGFVQHASNGATNYPQPAVAEWAYKQADAMLSERGKRP